MDRARITMMAVLLLGAGLARADVGPPIEAGRESIPLGVPGDRADAGAPRSTREDSSSIVPTLVVLGLIVAGALGARALARRAGTRWAIGGGVGGGLGLAGRAPAGVVEVLARYPVGRGQSLALIKIDRFVLVVSHTSAGMRTLCEVRDPDEVASLLLRTRDEEGQTADATFRNLMERFDSDHDAADPAPAAGSIPVIDLTARRAVPKPEPAGKGVGKGRVA